MHPAEQHLLGKLKISVHEMAQSTKSIKDRLRSVYLEHLMHAVMQIELPESEEKIELQDLRRALATRQDERFGAVNASIDAMSHQNAKKLVELICNVHSSLEARTRS